MTCAEIVSTVSDIVVRASAVVAVILAWRGLTTWRDQLQGTVEYDLARRVLKGLYRARDAVAGVRHSFMFAEEMPDPPPERAKSMNREQLRHYGVSQAYQHRWNAVVEARREVDPDLLESEVLWGPELRRLVIAVRDVEHELFTAVRHHVELQNPDSPQARRDAIDRIVQGRREVLYAGMEGEEDAFLNDYNRAIGQVETYLRLHLRKT